MAHRRLVWSAKDMELKLAICTWDHGRIKVLMYERAVEVRPDTRSDRVSCLYGSQLEELPYLADRGEVIGGGPLGTRPRFY